MVAALLLVVLDVALLRPMLQPRIASLVPRLSDLRLESARQRLDMCLSEALPPPIAPPHQASALIRMSAGSQESAASEVNATSLPALATFFTLVLVKTATDLLTNCVARPPATAMALVAELSIFPLILLLLAASNGLQLLRRRMPGSHKPDGEQLCDIPGVFRQAARDRPGRLLGIGFIYAVDSLFYFYAHSNIGAVTYTVLAQTKIFFTVAVLRMRGMLSKLRPAQRFGLVLLFAGANLVTLRDVAVGVAASGGNRGLGISCLLAAQVPLVP
mmetsp:Transcript_39115/g.91529  ORF Transcript_39115/g.91529 Transcript_39115/m.91529 type:complete len:273 (-) Transcript_39115:74-892(-)